MKGERGRAEDRGQSESSKVKGERGKGKSGGQRTEDG